MYHLFILYLLSSAATVMCMDKPSSKNIDFQLDDGSTYSIAKRKVKEESNTLCDCYYSQKKINPIIVPNISPEEITLFDQATDWHIHKEHPESFSHCYNKLTPDQKRTLTIAAGEQLADGTKKLCAQRLTAQLAVEWFGRTEARRNIIPKCIPEWPSLMMHLNSSMIIESIHNNLITQSSVSSINPDNCYKKHTTDGAVIFMPKVTGLNVAGFNGKPSKFATESEGKKYSIVLVSPKTERFVTRTEFINDTIDASKLHVWTQRPEKLVKTIDHKAPIARACLSPDGRWLVTASEALTGRQHSKLMLTSLDISSDQYLSDMAIVPQWNFDSTCCFNNASTLLAFQKPRKIELLSLDTKQTVCALDLPQDLPFDFEIAQGVFQEGKYNPKSLELAFNHNDTRLVACLENGLQHTQDTFMIWDISNLNNPKRLQLMHTPIKPSRDATITFDYPKQDTVAISTDYTTFFFDLNSGAFLGETETVKGQENATHAAACSIMHSPITYIAKNIDKKSSCINLHERKSGKCVGTIMFNEPAIVGLGVTHNGRSLVATFDGYKTITTELISDQENAPLMQLAKEMSLVEFYGLMHLHKAKKNNQPVNMSARLLEYMQNFGTDKPYKNVIQSLR